MSHQEKQHIFDEYAISQGFKDWDNLFEHFFHDGRKFSWLYNHMYNACDLVQAEQQKRIAEKARMKVKTEHGEFEAVSFGVDDRSAWIDEDSIINPENLIK